MDERVTLYSDPADPALLGQPFDAEGLPLARTVWIEKGILRNLSYSRFWAQKQGEASRPVPALAGGLDARGRHEEHRGADRRLRARHPRHALLLHPLARARTVLQTGPDARRHVPDREGQDHARAEELPLEREPAADAEPARGHRPSRADDRGTDDAGAAHPRLQLLLVVGRGVTWRRRSAEGRDCDEPSHHSCDVRDDDRAELGRIRARAAGRGVFNNNTRGHDPLVQFVHDWRDKRNGANRRHWNANLVITPSAGGANGSIYLMLMDVSASIPPAPVSTAMTRGHAREDRTRVAFQDARPAWRCGAENGSVDSARADSEPSPRGPIGVILSHSVQPVIGSAIRRSRHDCFSSVPGAVSRTTLDGIV